MTNRPSIPFQPNTIGVSGIFISEYDINIADDNQQRQVMAQQFPLFYEHSQVAGVTLWGYLYGQTWRPNTGLIRDGEPRPAMDWLCTYFTGQNCGDAPTPTPTPTPDSGSSSGGCDGSSSSSSSSSGGGCGY